MKDERMSRAFERARLRFVSPVGVGISLVRTVREHPANGGRWGRPVAAWVLATALHRITGQPCVAALGERSKLLVEPTWLTPVEASAIYGNPPDHPWTSIWSSVVGAGDLVLDVGANKGAYSILAAEQGAEVIAVEPSSTTRALLMANLRLNDMTDSVSVVPAAVGAEAGTTLLTVGTGVLNHVVESTDDLSEERLAGKFVAHRPTGVEEVEVVCLDDVVGDRFVVAMKLDVEGQEESALRGAERLLAEHRVGYIQMETNDTAAKHYGRDGGSALDLLRGHGYEVFGVDAVGGLHLEGTVATGHDVLAVFPDSPFWDRFRGSVSRAANR